MPSLLKKLVSPLYYAVSDVPKVRDRADRAVWGSRFRHWRAENPCREFESRPALYQFLLESKQLDGAIDYLEFGVWEGESIRWWVGNNQDPQSTFFGFDSFEGLPVNWGGMPQGSFSTGGKIPDISDPRCHFVKGWFQDTFPGWFKERTFDRRLVINLDADLYGSTLLVLVPLLPHLKTGDIVIFDELHSFMHEFRAFVDALTACKREFKALGRSDGWSQVALEVV